MSEPTPVVTPAALRAATRLVDIIHKNLQEFGFPPENPEHIEAMIQGFAVIITVELERPEPSPQND